MKAMEQATAGRTSRSQRTRMAKVAGRSRGGVTVRDDAVTRKVEQRRGMGHVRPAMADQKKKRGRPTVAQARTQNVSFRVRPEYRKALEIYATKNHRKPLDMARVLVGKILIDAKLLPEDFDF